MNWMPYSIYLKTCTIKDKLTSITIVRVGTSGSLQADIPVDHFVLADYGIGFDGMLWSYDCNAVLEHELDMHLLHILVDMSEKAKPYIVQNSPELGDKLAGNPKVHRGITATAGGFFGPQGRVLRLALQDTELNHKTDSFLYKGHRVTNLEMKLQQFMDCQN